MREHFILSKSKSKLVECRLCKELTELASHRSSAAIREHLEQTQPGTVMSKIYVCVRVYMYIYVDIYTGLLMCQAVYRSL